MRLSALALAAVVGLIAIPSVVRAAPVVGHDPALSSAAPIIEVRGGCGPGFHPAGWRDRWGRWRQRCMPNRRW